MDDESYKDIFSTRLFFTFRYVYPFGKAKVRMLADRIIVAIVYNSKFPHDLTSDCGLYSPVPCTTIFNLSFKLIHIYDFRAEM